MTRGAFNKWKGRHEKLKIHGVGPEAKGKGYNKGANGVIVTHGRGVVPRWKMKRLGLYKYDVYQTVLISKSNRLAGSQNQLETFRYPIKAPESLDSERVQCMLFSPFCSHYSGIHSTMCQKIQADGTDLDHYTDYLFDVIQNKVDIARHDLPSGVDGTHGSAIAYQNNQVIASAARATTGS